MELDIIHLLRAFSISLDPLGGDSCSAIKCLHVDQINYTTEEVQMVYCMYFATNCSVSHFFHSVYALRFKWMEMTMPPFCLTAFFCC